MATNYPTTQDSYSVKVDNTTTVMAADVNNLQDAVTALEAKVGVTSSTVSSSIDYFINNASGLFKTHVHDGTTSALIPGSSLTTLNTVVTGAGALPWINVAGINALTIKTTLASGDYFIIEDSASSYAKKKATLSSFNSVLVDLANAQTITGAKTLGANLNFAQYQGISLVLENRTSDPSSPVVGQIWFRTDL